jgi:colanic acid/amylovoran/stewartan biosynthesis glycosyltransferase WcaL/AmsK/CpsK
VACEGRETSQDIALGLAIQLPRRRLGCGRADDQRSERDKHGCERSPDGDSLGDWGAGFLTAWTDGGNAPGLRFCSRWRRNSSSRRRNHANSRGKASAVTLAIMTQQRAGTANSWVLPQAPWILHSTIHLGNLTDRWIPLQSAPSQRYETRLLGREVAPEAVRAANWLVARDRLDLWLAHKATFRSAGLSSRWLARPFEGSPPAVLHVHYGPLAALQVRLARRMRVPLVASFYGYDATERRFIEDRRWRRRYGRLFDSTQAVIVEGPAMAARVQALGCPAEKLHVVRLPADAESLRHCERPKAAGFLCVLAGRFIEKKGFDVGIRAFARGLADRPDARLLIIGGGELEPELRGIVAELGIAGRVRWGGRMPFREFMTEIGRANLGLYPSRTASSGDSEGGAPVTLIEAQWLGVPSLVSDHDDLPFVAAPEGTVILAPTAIDAWAETLRELSGSPARLERMGAAARQYARTYHSPEENVRQREAVYGAVAAGANELCGSRNEPVETGPTPARVD